MRRSGVLALTIRTALAVVFSAVGCNLILGNEPRTLVEVTDGGASGSVATASESLGSTSTGGSGGASAGEAGRGGAAPDAGGAAGAEGGEAGEGTGTDATGSGGSSSSSTSSTGVACACIPGYTESMEEPCGNCGTATLTKLCNEDCQWDPYGPPGECMNQGVCTPNAPLHEYGHCELGGWRDRTSTCGADCQPGLWTDGECEWGPNPCTGCACISDCTDPDTGGTTCLWIDCPESQARAECEVDIEDVCGTPNEPVTFKEWLPN